MQLIDLLSCGPINCIDTGQLGCLFEECIFLGPTSTKEFLRTLLIKNGHRIVGLNVTVDDTGTKRRWATLKYRRITRLCRTLRSIVVHYFKPARWFRRTCAKRPLPWLLIHDLVSRDSSKTAAWSDPWSLLHNGDVNNKQTTRSNERISKDEGLLIFLCWANLIVSFVCEKKTGCWSYSGHAIPMRICDEKRTSKNVEKETKRVFAVCEHHQLKSLLARQHGHNPSKQGIRIKKSSIHSPCFNSNQRRRRR